MLRKTSHHSNFLFVSPTAVLGGAERTMFNLITKLLKDGNRVTIYIMSRGKQAGWDTLNNHPNFRMIIKDYGSEKSSLPAFFLSLTILSHLNSFDYTFSSHTHVNGALSLMRKFKFLKTKRLICRESTVIFERYHGRSRQVFKGIYKYMYGSQDLIICQTEKMKKSLIKNLGFKPAENIQVILNPVNLDYINYQLEHSDEYQKPFKILLVGCGRFIALKQFNILIDAFANIASDFPSTGLVLIGDGPERSKLEKQIKELDLENRILLTGKISNPIQWFNKADIGIISSEVEGFPNVLIEMMASGTKHIITTPCSDGVYTIPNITVTPTANRESIEDALRSFLKKPFDNSTKHKVYIEKYRSVDTFWNNIEGFL